MFVMYLLCCFFFFILSFDLLLIFRLSCHWLIGGLNKQLQCQCIKPFRDRQWAYSWDVEDKSIRMAFNNWRICWQPKSSIKYNIFIFYFFFIFDWRHFYLFHTQFMLFISIFLFASKSIKKRGDNKFHFFFTCFFWGVAFGDERIFYDEIMISWKKQQKKK